MIKKCYSCRLHMSGTEVAEALSAGVSLMDGPGSGGKDRVRSTCGN
jgi:hypothetical protein